MQISETYISGYSLLSLSNGDFILGVRDVPFAVSSELLSDIYSSSLVTSFTWVFTNLGFIMLRELASSELWRLLSKDIGFFKF